MLAIGNILAIFVSLLTRTLPKSKPREMKVALSDGTTKKDCYCCSEMTTEESTAAPERIVSVKKQRLAYQKTSELIQQYGLKEGVRRLKQFHPEIAEHFEHFTEKYTVAEEH